MGDLPLPVFYYPVCTSTSFGELDANVLCVPPGKSSNDERLHKSETKELRQLLGNCNEMRESMRMAIAQHKYNEIFHKIVPITALAVESDPMTSMVSKTLERDFIYIEQQNQIMEEETGHEFIPPTSIETHVKICNLATVYSDALKKTIDWIKLHRDTAAIWIGNNKNPIKTRRVSTTQSTNNAIEAAPLVSNYGPDDYHRPDTVPYTPTFRWIASGTMMHSKSQCIMISGSLIYDLCMSLVIVMFSRLNIASILANSYGVYEKPVKKIVDLLNEAREVIIQVKAYTSMWVTKPASNLCHAELQPEILAVLDAYCRAFALFYRKRLFKHFPVPQDFDVFRRNSDNGYKSIYIKTDLSQTIKFSALITESFVSYGRLVYGKPDFAIFLHACASISLARIGYLFSLSMLRKYSDQSATIEKREDRIEMTKNVLHETYTRIDTAMGVMYDECKTINGWNAYIQDMLRESTRMAASSSNRMCTILGPRLSRRVDVNPTCISIHKLYEASRSTWELLNKAKVTIDIVFAKERIEAL